MWLIANDSFPEPAWEGQLLPIGNGMDPPRPTQRGSSTDDTGSMMRELPIVVIGRPEVWSLEEIFSSDELPRLVRAQQESWRFFLIRLYCSFRPMRNNTVLEWARFLIRVPPDENGHQPIAFDLHPTYITEETRRNVRVCISPSLHFQELEAKIGEVNFGIEYREIHPIVTSIAPGLPEASWDYEATSHIPLTGGKWMHLVLKAPRNMSKGNAILDLTADVRVRGFRRATVMAKREESDHLVVDLW